jgi:hypothetical protein
MRKKKSAIEMTRQCVAWNNATPIGADVIVTKDAGNEVHTKTRGEAYVCESGYPVIFLEGISGYYLLDRVRRAPSERGERHE